MKRTLTRLWAVGSRLPRPLRRRLNALPGVARLRRRSLQLPGGPPPRPGGLRPVVYLPTWARWDVMRQRPQYLLAAFAAAGHDVYFVDPREPHPRVADRVHLVPDLSAVPGRFPILYVHFAPLVGQIDLFDQPVVVYDILDDLSIYLADEEGLPVDRTVAHHHPRLVEMATLLVFSAPVLADRYGRGDDRELVVPNGVDVARFAAAAPTPPDVPAGDGILVGYHGAIAPWLDFALLEELVRLRAGDRFLFVGPVVEGAGAAAERLAVSPNVTMLGERPPDRMPGYVRSFDVGIVPFLVDHLTEAVSPLKMYEYLAAGVPVVATPLPACVEEDTVTTAGDAPGFDRAITTAAARAGDPVFVAAAAAAAVAAGWDRRVAVVRDALDLLDALVVPS